MSGTYDTPTIPNSQLPALLGLTAARNGRVIIDAARNRVYMVGPGEYDLLTALPPGTQSYDCVYAPSGHMLLPCAEFGQGRRRDESLTQQVPLPVTAAACSAAATPSAQ